MPRMTLSDARAFWELSPEVRLAIVRRAGFLGNDYLDSLDASEWARALDDRGRFFRERVELGLEPMVGHIDTYTD